MGAAGAEGESSELVVERGWVLGGPVKTKRGERQEHKLLSDQPQA